MSSLADRDLDAAEAAKAFAQVYAETYGPLVAYCRRLTASPVDAEELAQAALVQAWASWSRYAPGRPFWPWVTTIARNQAVDQRRRVARGIVSSERVAARAVDHRPLPDEIVEDATDRQLAIDALRQLRPRYRRIVALREIDGVSYEAIAESEGTSVEAVRGSLRRARLALRLAFSQMGGGVSAVFGFELVRRLRDRLADAAHRFETPASMAALSKAGEVVAAFVALAVVGSSGGLVPSSARPDTLAAAPAAGAPAVAGAASPDRIPEIARAGDPQTTGLRGDRPSPRGNAGNAGLPVAPPGGLAPDGVYEPEDADFVHVAASPRYAQDGVLYASGAGRERCPLGCAVLFKSTDRGQTWQRLRGRGFAGGLIMLPPAYPADDRIFVISEYSLAVSRNDGESFENLTPLGGAAAMSPGFSSVDRRILVGAIPGWEYHDEVEKVTPLSFLPPPVGPALTFSFAPDIGDSRVFVGGTSNSDRGESTVWLCDAGRCGDPTALPGAAGPPAIAVSPRFAESGVAFAWRHDRLYRTLDAGRSFTAVALPAKGPVAAVAYDLSGRVFVAIDGFDEPHVAGGLFASADDGATWIRLGESTALGGGARSITTLNDGRLLAGPSHDAGGGLLCSADGGRSWARRCSA